MKKLLSLEGEELKEKFFMFDQNARKSFLSEVEMLKKMTMGECVKPESCKNIESTMKFDLNSLQTSMMSENEMDLRHEVLGGIKKKFDVFISYRRSNGSDLASLLKFVLSFQGFKVFFDVDSLTSGHFGQSLIKNVQESKNFILLLTPNSLDRCIDDHDNKDWVKKEISTALVSNCNIIPVAKDFNNEIFYHKGLPDDIKSLIDLNHIIWHHDAQVSFELQKKTFFKLYKLKFTYRMNVWKRF